MSSNKYKILIVEDEANIRSFVSANLEENGFRSIEAKNASEAKLMFLSYNPDLVILDLGLPDMDGLEIIKIIRESSSVPIIILSARTEEADKVEALDFGANDYVTKPFGTAELMARVRSCLRSARKPAAGSVYTLRDMQINYDKRIVTVGGEEVRLTQTEYNILAFLSENAGKMMTYLAIIRAVWGVADEGSVKKLQVNMAHLRKKLGAAPGKKQYVINELGVGYRMADK
ncbi:MAG: response regulator transcription factor [Christensenellaceae bacterium]|nr:response regulator transcription factor [Christensenellaceae bacterium]